MVTMYGGWNEDSPAVKRIHRRIAHSTGIVTVLKRTADEVARSAERRLNMAENRTGASTIKRSRGKLDEYVELRSPGGLPAVLSIEFGNKHGGGGLGPLRGAANDAARRHKR